MLSQNFAIFIEISENFKNIFSQLSKKILVNNCKKICCFGKKSDEYHDLFDEKIEDQELFSIVTTSLTDETEEEAVEYFLTLSGSKPFTLLMYIESTRVKKAVFNNLKQ